MKSIQVKPRTGARGFGVNATVSRTRVNGAHGDVELEATGVDAR